LCRPGESGKNQQRAEIRNIIMAMSLASGGGSGRRRANRRFTGRAHLISEINMTPFIDVMLVLLIIFMVSAPLLVNGVPLDLPKTSASAIKGETEPLTVSVDRQGRLAIKQEYYTQEQFIAKLRALGAATPEGFKQRIVVMGDKQASYDTILEVLALLQKTGFGNVALASLPK